MTNVPEAFHAREARMACATVGIVTDYDCWLEDPARHANVAGIFELYGQSPATARSLLDYWLAQPVPTPELAIPAAQRSALLTSDAALTPA